MKIPLIRFVLTSVALAALAGTDASAQSFSTGSTGSYGPLVVTQNTTIDLPPDGILHCTTVQVNLSATLTFKRNSLNTPVYLLATGDVNIDGVIDVSGARSDVPSPGLGGPGGFDGGHGAFGLGPTPAGDGRGPGAGRTTPDAGIGVYGLAVDGNTNVYGNALITPSIGGSGGTGLAGNPGYGGGGGGGAILIASPTRIAVGSSAAIYSRGGTGPFGGRAGAGSGGAIRLVAPLVTGLGSLDAGGYSQGRIRIDCEDRLGFRSLHLPAYATRGSQLFVFPPNPGRLDIIEAAGRSIAENATSSVEVSLPADAPATQTVRIQAKNFTATVPIRLVVTPENAPSTVRDTEIAVAGGTGAVSIEVTLPAGQISHIDVWTR